MRAYRAVPGAPLASWANRVTISLVMGYRGVLVLALAASACGNWTSDSAGHLRDPGVAGGGRAAGDAGARETEAGKGGGPSAAGGTGGASGSPAAGAPAADKPPCAPNTLANYTLLDRQSAVELLRNVTAIDNDLTITGDVTDLSPLACLSKVRDLYIENTTQLKSLAGLERLTSVRRISINADCTDEGQNTCTVNQQLSNVSFEALSEVELIHVFKNPALTTLSFARLTRLPEISMVRNPALVRISIPALTQAGTVDIFDCPIENLTFFSALTEIGSLGVERTKIRDLRGLEGLTGIKSLALRNNIALASLAGADSLEQAGAIYLQENPALVSLRGLGALRSLEFLRILRNAALPTCEAHWLRDLIGAQSITSGVDISDNGSGACP